MAYAKRTILSFRDLLDAFGIEMTNEEVEARLKAYILNRWPDTKVEEISLIDAIQITLTFKREIPDD